MVRDDAELSGEVTLSSIALLQERFRQLERTKELRQERELMRTLSESESSHAAQIPTNRRSAGRQRLSPSSPPPAAARPHCQLALSLWPDSHAKRGESLAKPYHSPTCQLPQFNLENSESDIDTSLRL